MFDYNLRWARKFKDNNRDLTSVNIIGENTTLTGTFSGKSIRIDGSFNGTIVVSGKSTIGKTGTFNGKLNTNDIEISGVFDGKLIATGIITIKSSAIICGDLIGSLYVVEKGANINANINTTTNSII